MRLLLDSSALIRWHEGSLRRRTREWLESGDSQVYVSVVTPWELGMKIARGKLEVAGAIQDIVRTAEFETLPIRWDHAEIAARLPALHGDPFDRMLVAQAQCEGLSVVTDDEAIARYQVHVVPAR